LHTWYTIPNDRGDLTPAPIILHGTQHITKFNRRPPSPSSTLSASTISELALKASKDQVDIFLGVFRVESKGVDLVVTFNVPIKSELDTGTIKSEEDMNKIRSDFETFVRTLTIQDFGLFA
jgi:hypothetical protein